MFCFGLFEGVKGVQVSVSRRSLIGRALSVLGLVGLVGVLCWVTVLSRLPTARAEGAGIASGAAGRLVVEDGLEPPPPGQPSRVARPEVSGAGFTTFEAGAGYVFVNPDALTIRLVSTSEGDVERVRAALQSVVGQVRSISGVSLTVASGTVPDVAGDLLPGTDEIVVSVDSTSPCGGSPLLLGCGGPRNIVDLPDSGIRVIHGGRVWIMPRALDLPAPDLGSVIAHEIGHALGLDHFASPFEGAVQVMAPICCEGGPAYRSGDANGLRFLHPRPPPPANDAFVAATGIAGWSGTQTGTNASASHEPGEPQHGRRPGGASVWYRWRAPAAGVATFNTFGSAFDTLLAVYRGRSVGGLTRVTANDNFAGPQSQVTFTTRRGAIYRIAVDGAAGEFGVIHLRHRRG